MCLYVFVSRGCFRHRSALANGFFVASISIPFALFVSLSLTCSFVLSVSHFLTNYNTSALRRSLSLVFFFLSRCFRWFLSRTRTLWCEGGKVWGKIHLSKVSIRWLFSSVVHALTNTRNKIRFASFECPAHSCARSLSLTLSWLRACGCVFVGGHVRTRWKQNQISSPFIPFGLCESESV